MKHVVEKKRLKKMVDKSMDEEEGADVSDEVPDDINDEANDEYTVNPKVTMEYNYRLGEGSFVPDDVNLTLSLPMKSLKAAEKLLAEVGDYTPGETEEAQKWLSCFQNAKEAYVPGNSFNTALHRSDSDWRQSTVHKDFEMSVMAGEPLKTKSSGDLSGEDAILKINSALNLGAIIKVPLWHSGIWVTIKAPSSTTLITVDRMIANEKIILGRQTNGMVFSNVSVYLRKTLIDLAMDSITDSSMIEFTKGKLLDCIKVTDYPTLVWGLACSIYQDGYQISQPCINDISKCNHVVEEKVSLSKLAWIDNWTISDISKDFMLSSLKNKKEIDEILAYQETCAWNSGKRVPVTDKFDINLKVPTLKEDLDGGIKWVEGIVREVDQLFTDVEEDTDIKNVRISERARASTLQQYVSWIASCDIIEGIDDDCEIKTITDRDTIALACESMTSNIEACDIIFRAIGELIDESTICVIGIPSYECPKCGKHNAIKGSKHPEVIPLAIDENFFILIRHWTLKVVNQRNTF